MVSLRQSRVMIEGYPFSASRASSWAVASRSYFSMFCQVVSDCSTLSWRIHWKSGSTRTHRIGTSLLGGGGGGEGRRRRSGRNDVRI